MPDVPAADNGLAQPDDGSITEALGLPPTPFYQPIVSVPEGATVGYEALARWPSLGYPDPQLVFEVASSEPAILAELDQRCITGALDTFLQSGRGAGALLFVNTHPSCDFPSEAVDARAERLTERRLRLVFELTERHLLDRPPTLMKKIDAIRQRGWAIAFDDVGADSAALPLLDVVAPEVIKLDMRLVQSVPGVSASQVMPAVLKYREGTEAVIVAEGVETSSQYNRALAWGATLAQGHRFGPPVPLSTLPLMLWSDFEVPAHQRVRPPRARNSPFNVLFAAGAKPQPAALSTIQSLARHIRIIATLPENPSIVLVVLPDDDLVRVNQTALLRMRKAITAIPFFAIYGHGLPEGFGAIGIRTVSVAPSDPLAKELLILALGPHAAAAIAVHGFGRESLTKDRSELRYVVSYDRELITTIVCDLLATESAA
ncbi:EAL domain-containing protein [Mycobacterium sp.]|uniref:EAL domain-containing protein n=1 Tax=Mycobacterium sp. TaxID=1785 RepID=UPI0025FDCF2E|nr:EAL domain-containing protein [Mycobacterium sp.]MBW0014722.1 EAL domain-containing protein [Mycobacterium sp.]